MDFGKRIVNSLVGNLKGAAGRRAVRVLSLALVLLLGTSTFANALAVSAAAQPTASSAKLPAVPLAFREARTIGIATVAANSFRWLPSGLLEASGNVNLGGSLATLDVSAATLSTGGAVRALTLNASGVALHLDTIHQRGGNLVASRLTVVPPASWNSQAASSDTPVVIGDAAGATISLPDIQIANGVARVTGLHAALHRSRDGASLSLDAARLLVQQPGGAIEMPLRGRLASDGTFSGYVPRLTLDAAGAQIAMRGVLVSSGGMRATETRLRLPASMGGWQSAPIANLSLTDSGLRFAGSERVSFPGAQIGMGAPRGYPLRDVSGTLIPAGSGAYQVQLDGTATVAITGYSTTTRGRITLRPNGVTTAQLASFTVNLAGLEMLIPPSALDEDGLIRLPKVGLKAPEKIGGFGVEVYNVTFDPETKEVTIDGGSFRLPTLKFSGVTLGLEGSLVKEDTGYEIAAKGVFDLSGLGKPPLGCTGIEIEGRIFARTSLNQQMVIALDRPAEHKQIASDMLEYGYNDRTFKALSGLELRKAALKLSCKIPIPETTFSVSGISGEIALAADDINIKLGMSIENDITLPVVGSVLSASGEVEVRYRPVLRFALSAGVKVFTLQLARADMSIEYNPNTNIPRFKAGIYLQNIIMRGSAEVNAWMVPARQVCSGGRCYQANAEPYFTIRGNVTIGFKKGSWGFLGLPWWNFDIASAGVEAGRFRNGAWGFRADASFTAKVLFFKKTWRVGVYVDTQNNFKINPGDSFRLADPPSVQRARSAWNAAQARGAIGAELAAAAGPFSFTPSGEVIRQSAAITRTSALTFGLARPGRQKPTLTLINPAGVEITTANIGQFSDLIEYTVNLSETEAVTNTDSITSTYELFRVLKAEPGEVWKIKFDDSQTTDYNVDMYEQPLATVVSGASAKDTDGQSSFRRERGVDDESAELRLNLDITAPVSVTVYLANSADIGQGLTTQDELGAIEENAIELATLPGPGADGEMVIPVDLASIPSGNYRVLYRVDDGYNPLQEISAPETLHVDHSDNWPSTWAAEATENTSYDRTTIEWKNFPNADVDNYNVYIAEQPGEANPVGATLVISNGLSTYADLEGLSPGETYYVAIGAEDSKTGRLTLSDEFKIETPTAPFTISASATDLTIAAGGSAKTTITAKSAVVPYPDVVGLYAGCVGVNDFSQFQVRLPLVVAGANSSVGSGPQMCQDSQGISLLNIHNTLKPTATGASVEVTVQIPRSLAPGVYLVPVQGWGGGEEAIVMLKVTVTAPTVAS